MKLRWTVLGCGEPLDLAVEKSPATQDAQPVQRPISEQVPMLPQAPAVQAPLVQTPPVQAPPGHALSKVQLRPAFNPPLQTRPHWAS